MSVYQDPTYTAALHLLFGDPDEIADAPRVRRLARGRLEINGVVFAPRDGRDSGYRAPWVNIAEGYEC
jgi:hypothetical protein